MATRSRCRNVLPNGNVKRGRNSAETSKAISVRTAERSADLSKTDVERAGAADVSATKLRSLRDRPMLATIVIVPSDDSGPVGTRVLLGRSVIVELHF